MPLPAWIPHQGGQEVTGGHGAVGPRHVPGSSPGWTSRCPEPSAAARSSSSAREAGGGWPSEGSLGLPITPWCGEALSPPSTYLGVEGQSFRVVGVHHRGVRLEDDALARRLQRSAAHGHQQVYHLGAEQGLRGQPLMGLEGWETRHYRAQPYLSTSGHLLGRAGHDAQGVEGEDTELPGAHGWLWRGQESAERQGW